ncbi:4-hydroxybutyrate CoA-transferase [Mycobacterium gordonae]|uniref:4-hydroxybutyrate CoA-transferase n=1 Tax=Mycobacterium gordonae TaxID=1778 RepID=A0A0Q2LYZ3_MYCGO|nr:MULTISPECIES: acetyl-CoA hydrolase/transferase C-terminal domain-containing protein [Mycobacterium]KQH81041.1 4-hydroxybutyrate CoA-transferase [Mycobacterium gordonae]MDP7731197.1 acetyl-CoA hydrolase/transferase C-terminal domain-containing protein [Mycobacterium sp. TY813]
MIDFTRFLSRGDGVWWGQAAAEPRPLVDALILQNPRIGPIRTFTGLSWNDQLAVTIPGRMSMVSYGGLGELRELSRSGRLDVVPCHYSALPRMFAERRLPCDVGLIQVSPPDKDGTCSLGIGVDYVADAIPHTPVLIAEINQRMPEPAGSPRIPLDRFAATISTDRPLAEDPTRAAGITERRIAAHVAGLVDDGDTVQMGVGSLGAAALDALSEHEDLGFHTGMVTDGVLRLVDKGVITCRRKEIDPGLIVAGIALGSAELYSRVAELPARFLPTSYTHSPQILSQLSSLVSVNFAVEVDLTGQVGAEVSGGVYVGAVGGQVDFTRAASLTGKRSIIALRATSRGRSTIKASLDGGVVTTARSDVDTVVTEYGVAHLRGCSLRERARRLVAIAAPKFRDQLDRERSAL